MENNIIQLTTRRNIIDGYLITRIHWYGDLDQSSFLGRLYNLAALKSTDYRYKTAQEDIHKHTVDNNDWPEEWIFTDSRFNLLHSSDKEFTNFLCQTLHPTVRQNESELTTLLEIYNNNLKRDHYIIKPTYDDDGRPVFSAIDTSSKFAASTTTTSTKPETRKALIIGCSNYVHANLLVNPLNDANGMETVLNKLGFKVFKSIDPTQKELKTTIDAFGDYLKDADIGLFYFAGHGVQVKGLNYLIPTDANLTSEKIVEYDCVEAGRVLAHMEDARTRVNIIILDACRNNPFERNWGRGISLRGLATMRAPKGSLVAYSTEPGNTASDGEGSNGLYTEVLLNNIESKSTPVLTMFQKVRLEVMEKSKEAQIPWESTSLTADFYFNE